ncbi:MAG: outer membrane protein assembly factor BamD [Verrucomicrobia bacterium]|nr:outer membrane protein assembly factor BamD [Verrucomicrobiota bacterium]
MNRTLRFVLPLTALALLSFPDRAPAPIIYREGEGFNLGELSDVEIKKNAEEQFKLSERYEADGDYKRAAASYRLVVHRFPRADIAAGAQFKAAQMLEKLGKLQAAFYEYQALVQKYPRSPDFEPALQAQYNIGKAYLDGKRVDIYGVPTLPSMGKAQEMFQKIVTNAPYSRIAPLAQFGIGQALEKSGSITATINAYQQVVDRYPGSDVAPNAMYQIGYVYFVESRKTGYDQTAAVRAQESFEDFLLRYPNSEKVPQAQDNLKTLQARKTENSYDIAKFYDKQKNYKAAYVYYNEVVQQQPDSPEAERAKQRMDQIRAKVGENALKIGGSGTATAQVGADGRKLQAQADTAGRPDFVGPPAPTPTPGPTPAPAAVSSATPDQSVPGQKPMRTAPSDVTPAPVEPPPVGPAPVEPALPSQ